MDQMEKAEDKESGRSGQRTPMDECVDGVFRIMSPNKALQAPVPAVYWDLTQCFGGSPLTLCCMWSLTSPTIECGTSGRLDRGANPAALEMGRWHANE